MIFKIAGNEKEGLMLLIDKPADYSSARVVNIIKKKLKVKKAGHSGTLDPKATGLMIVCTQKMTKKLTDLIISDKEYEGIMRIGASTSSFDSETEVKNERDIRHITNDIIHESAKRFIGEIEQVPPMYSAIKYKGKPLYKYARKNKVIERLPRKVTIREFKITSIVLPELSFRTVCSKGTYVRALVNDFGEILGTGAYLKVLRRLRIGEYDVKNSITLEEFLKLDNNILYN
ncbi:MAG: tRNA pseudouridine(55) synthase TruB [Ignavibacteria bacterium]|jgi:tRNA pseudouridine55 synthase